MIQWIVIAILACLVMILKDIEDIKYVYVKKIPNFFRVLSEFLLKYVLFVESYVFSYATSQQKSVRLVETKDSVIHVVGYFGRP